MQPWKNKEVLEIGYLLARSYWHKGYATEAAKACKKYAFERLKADEVCSIIRDTNTIGVKAGCGTYNILHADYMRENKKAGG